MTATTIAPNKNISSTTPNHVENGAGDWVCCRICSVSAMLVHQFQRFDEPRIAHRKERSLADDAQERESQGGSHRNDRDEVPQTQMDSGPVKGRQHHEIHVEQLHEEHPVS